MKSTRFCATKASPELEPLTITTFREPVMTNYIYINNLGVRNISKILEISTCLSGLPKDKVQKQECAP